MALYGVGNAMAQAYNHIILLLATSDGELYGHHRPWRDKFLTHLLQNAPSYGFEVYTLERYMRIGHHAHNLFEHTLTLANRKLDLLDASLDLCWREMTVAQNNFIEMPVFYNRMPLDGIHVYS